MKLLQRDAVELYSFC